MSLHLKKVEAVEKILQRDTVECRLGTAYKIVKEIDRIDLEYLLKLKEKDIESGEKAPF